MINGKTVLITGGTGSFGKKFVEIVLKRFKPKKLLYLVEMSKNNFKWSKISKVRNHHV